MEHLPGYHNLRQAGAALFSAVLPLQVNGFSVEAAAQNPYQMQELKTQVLVVLENAKELEAAVSEVHNANQTFPSSEDADGRRDVSDYIDKVTSANTAAIEWLQTVLTYLGNLDEDDQVPQIPAPEISLPEAEHISKRPQEQARQFIWGELDEAHRTLKALLQLNTEDANFQQALDNADQEATVTETRLAVDYDPGYDGPSNGKGKA